MNHYKELKDEFCKSQDHLQALIARDGSPAEYDLKAFNLPASLVLIAIKYALKSAWSDEDRQEIKASVMKLYDEVVVPLDVPVVDGAIETAIEKIGRGLLATVLDIALG